jgi:2-dehydro-3-deoxyphosphogluconate aldolase / (4S)-4-hydroxy-2-oxoglutarate aldolase
MTDPFDTVAAVGVVPVIAIDRAQDATALADALLEGGLPVAEITFRTPAAAEVIAKLSAERPRLLVGAGTVLDLASLHAARQSGARFGLAPGFDAEIVKASAAAAWPFAPGIMTPSDLSAAARHGARLIKFFPAGTAGGPAGLDAISAPFAHLGLRFIPTGGVSFENMAEWLRMKSVAAIGGTWIARAEDIRDGRFAEITRKARAAVDKAKALRAAREP